MRPLRFILTAACLTSCKIGKREAPVFELLDPARTGVTFANTITTTDSLNVQTDVYIYNGAGVAVGDIDNDGLPDIFFAGNQVSSRLYLNKGNMHFEDITEHAGVKTNRWATGVTMVDINNDGYLDIYVAVSGPEWSKGPDRANLLFINNGDRTFTESAAKYGIADTNFTTQAAWLDYNGDGCLDLFLLNNSPKDFSRGVMSQPNGMRATTPGSYNELYRNNCNGTFTNVSKEAGILEDAGYGLGVVVSDFNGDGWPDIYVSNDGLPNDVLYLNNGNGTFTNTAARSLRHTSTAGMGVDAADFNNDGWPDILQVDMLPHDLSRQKRMSGYMTYGSLLDRRGRGFRDDYAQNSLQLNAGVTVGSDPSASLRAGPSAALSAGPSLRSGQVPVFSEIARLAGVSATDWSWSALFADFDNDGYKDIFIGNGYPKAVNDLDYAGTAVAALRRGEKPRARAILKQLPGITLPNYVFRNNGDLTFSDKSTAWGMDQPSFSYGAAYADLDNDGRLDLVVNNIDAPAFIYKNVLPRDNAHHYLRVRLDGEAPNRRGIGANIAVFAGGQKQYVYQTPYRGFMSSVDDRPHFGLGRATVVDSMDITWPDGRYQRLTKVAVDRELVVRQSEAKQRRQAAPVPKPIFALADPMRAIAYEQSFDNVMDYSLQPLLPYMLSRHGPPIAVADVNGDGLDDVFVGGTPGRPGRLFLQQKDGSFVGSTAGQPWEEDKAYEDWAAVFFDANGDGLPDLYVASGGYQLTPESPLLQDRLYINQGGGRFKRDPNALPPMLASKGVVRVGDFNEDGKPDLFVGGRLTPSSYPYPTRSFILRNDGGHFTDVTEQMAPELVHPGGMITDAVFTDFDGDGRLDLVTAGEWMPIQFFHNDGERFTDVTARTGLPPMRGWWFSLAVGDFDRDGRPDLVAGNLGLNYTYTTSKDSAFGVYAGDFTSGRRTDVVLTKMINGTEYSMGGYSPLGREIYTLGLEFPTYGSFADASVRQLFTSTQLEKALHYRVDTFASVYLHNEGGGVFTATALPNPAQIAPIKSILVQDVDGDGNLDLIVAGNLYDAEPNTPRADAGNGLWLRGDGRGHFTPVSPRESGFFAPLNVAGLALIKTPTGRAVLVANTGDSVETFVIRKPGSSEN
jgi:hypothetical protein